MVDFYLGSRVVMGSNRICLYGGLGDFDLSDCKFEGSLLREREREREKERRRQAGIYNYDIETAA